MMLLPLVLLVVGFHPGKVPAYSAADLPPCDSRHIHWIVFNLDDNRFNHCDGSAWGFTATIPITRVIATTSPLQGGGDLTADRTLSLQASAASKLFGRGSASGAGNADEITLGTNLSMSGTTLNATGGGGASWGSITGTLSSQTDLQTALNGKEASGAFSGVGACAANTWVSTLNDTAAPTCTQPAFSNLSGSATDAQIPNTITLDNLTQITTRAISDTTGTLTVSRGGTGAAPGADDQLLVSDSSSGATWRTLTDCQGAGKALTYTAATNTWGCNTISGGGGATYVVLASDVTNATTSYANITGLSWSVAASTRYDVECKLVYSANATTTGIGVSWTGPASPTLTSALMTSGIGAQTTGGTTIVGNDTGSTTTASVATSGNAATFEGIWSNGANAGTLQMRVKSEVAIANAIVVKAGSWCKVSTY